MIITILVTDLWPHGPGSLTNSLPAPGDLMLVITGVSLLAPGPWSLTPGTRGQMTIDGREHNHSWGATVNIHIHIFIYLSICIFHKDKH